MLLTFHRKAVRIFPYGNSNGEVLTLKYTSQDISTLVRQTRKGLGVTQRELALTSGTGLRFIIDLEKGKETAEIGKVLIILQTLGIQMPLTPPPTATKRG